MNKWNSFDFSVHLVRVFLFLFVVLIACGTTFAQTPPLPTGGNVALGTAAISQAGNKMTIQQDSARAVINWNTFDVGAGNGVIFNQPGVNAAALNRVISSNPSAINGLLKSNGKVYLINQNGILVGENGVINAGGGFIGSTLDVNRQNVIDWYNGGSELEFSRPSGRARTIENQGLIKSPNGNVILMSDHIVNSGRILATNGKVGLIAGADQVKLVDSTNPSITVRPSAASPGGTGIDNQGTIKATAVRLDAVQGNIYALAINNQGTIRADAVHIGENGEVTLVARGGGKVRAGGTIVATSIPAGNGKVTVRGGKVKLDGTVRTGDMKVVASSGARMSGSVIATGTVELDVDGGVEQTSLARLEGEKLELKGSGDFDLRSRRNDVDKISADVVGAIYYRDADDLKVVQPGIQATGNVALRTGGKLTTFFAPISAKNLKLHSSDGVDFSFGAITTNKLLLVGQGNFNLLNPKNDINRIAGAVDGSVRLFDRDDLAVGAIGKYYGLMTSGKTLLSAVCDLEVETSIKSCDDVKLVSLFDDVIIRRCASVWGQNVDIGAFDNAFIAGRIFAKSDIDILTGGDIRVGRFGWLFGTDISMLAGNDIKIAGKVFACDDIDIISKDDVIIKRRGIVLGDDVFVKAKDNVCIAGILAAKDDVDVLAGDDIVVRPRGFVAAEDVYMSAEDDVEIAGKILGCDWVDIYSGDDTIIRRSGVVMGEDVFIGAHENVCIAGLVAAKDYIDIFAGEDIAVHRSGIVAGEDIFMTALNDVEIDGKVFGCDSVNIFSFDDIEVGCKGTVFGGEVFMCADDNVRIAGRVAAKYNIDIFAGYDILVHPHGRIIGHDVSLTALNDVEIAGKVRACDLVRILAGDDIEMSSCGSIIGRNILAVAADDIHVDGKIKGTGRGTILAIAGEDFTLSGGVIENCRGPIIISFDTRNAPYGIYGDGEFRMDSNSRIGSEQGNPPSGPIMIFGTTAHVAGGRWVSNLQIEDGAVIGGIAYDSGLGALGYLSPVSNTWRAHFPFIQWKHEQYGWDLYDLCRFNLPIELPIEQIEFEGEGPCCGIYPAFPFDIPFLPCCKLNPELPYSDPFTSFFHGPGLDAGIWDANLRRLAADQFERIPIMLLPPSKRAFRYDGPLPRPANEITGASSYDYFCR